jgi:ubiquinol-cytochrome c reductase cytochrome c subunit
MRRVVALAIVLPLIAVGSAAAASGTPKPPLARYGYHLYGEYCASCHGGNAEGRVKASGDSSGAGPGRLQDSQMGVGPSLHGVGALAGDFYLRMGYMPLVQVGEQPTHRNTPLFGELQIRALVAYIASLGGGPKIPKPHPSLGNLARGQALFTEHCAGCHQVVAQGGYVTGALPPPLDRVNATEIAEAVRIGPYVMPKFTEKAIPNPELNSIVRYVEYDQHPDHPGGAGLDFLGPVPEGLITWFVAMPLLLLLCVVIGRRLSS